MSLITRPNTKESLENLQREIEHQIAPLGYEVVSLEQSNNPHQGRVITLYIDFLSPENGQRISLEDCIRVNQQIDALFEQTTLIDGRYHLEVSSPGIERPLRKPADFTRFQGNKVRIHTYRALDEKELENKGYWEKNKKQKNFSGILDGLHETQDGSKIRLIYPDGSCIFIPMLLVSKAHLEYVEELIS